MKTGSVHHFTATIYPRLAAVNYLFDACFAGLGWGKEEMHTEFVRMPIKKRVT
jgi:hypothetical protein